MTRKQCEALAKRVYGPKAYTEEHPRAWTAERRDALRDRLQHAKARRKEIEGELAALKPRQPWPTLLKAAQFALAVDGDEPSWSQLREAVLVAERQQALAEELAELPTFQRDGGGLHSYRCVAGVDQGFCRGIMAWGDTWAECAAKLESKTGAGVP
jgi:hypothetical protein